jgi:hypothetical protein
MIEQVKSNERSSLLTLRFIRDQNIKTVSAIHQMLEQEITVSQKLKVKLDEAYDWKGNYE